jgi:hypothetical protein
MHLPTAGWLAGRRTPQRSRSAKGTGTPVAAEREASAGSRGGFDTRCQSGCDGKSFAMSSSRLISWGHRLTCEFDGVTSAGCRSFIDARVAFNARRLALSSLRSVSVRERSAFVKRLCASGVENARSGYPNASRRNFQRLEIEVHVIPAGW